MIPKNLNDYVKVYENHLPVDLCKSACENLEEINWHQHSFYQSHTNSYISHDHELSVSRDNIPEKEEINKQVWFALEQYILKDFARFGAWFGGWNGYSEIRFNRYDPTTQMKLHCDHIQSMFDGQRKGVPILTVLGALNDDYEGGELMMFGDQRVHLPAGSVVVFPSNFMFPHEVKPVKSGTRYSYVSWAW
jgi:predicted 2-oxoglutarate/Fe(II)-dependent dioxygenase YbiX